MIGLEKFRAFFFALTNTIGQGHGTHEFKLGFSRCDPTWAILARVAPCQRNHAKYVKYVNCYNIHLSRIQDEEWLFSVNSIENPKVNVTIHNEISFIWKGRLHFNELSTEVFGSTGSVGDCHFVRYSRKFVTLDFFNVKFLFGDRQNVHYSRKSRISESGTSENLCTSNCKKSEPCWGWIRNSEWPWIILEVILMC